MPKGNPNPSPETRIGQPRGPAPGGNSDIAKYREKAKRIAARASPKTIRRIVLMATGEIPGDATEIAAGKEVLDRGLGKASQEVSIEVVQRLQNETKQLITAVVNALDQFPEAKAAVNAALEPYLGEVQSDS